MSNNKKVFFNTQNEGAKTMNAMQFNKKRQRGIGMIELTVVLVVIGALLVYVFNYFRDNMRASEVKATVEQVTAMAGKLRQTYGLQNQYGTLNTAIAVQSRAIPEDLRVTGTNTAENNYGGAITVTPVNLTGTNDAVALSYANVPASQCSDIVNRTANVGRRITVGGTVVKPTDGVLNTATTGTACDAAAPVTIVWDVGRTGT